MFLFWSPLLLPNWTERKVLLNVRMWENAFVIRVPFSKEIKNFYNCGFCDRYNRSNVDENLMSALLQANPECLFVVKHIKVVYCRRDSCTLFVLSSLTPDDEYIKPNIVIWWPNLKSKKGKQIIILVLGRYWPHLVNTYIN